MIDDVPSRFLDPVITEDDIDYWKGNPVTKKLQKLLNLQRELIIQGICEGKYEEGRSENMAKGSAATVKDVINTIENLHDEFKWLDGEVRRNG